MTFFLSSSGPSFGRKKSPVKRAQRELLTALDAAARNREEAQRYFDAVSDDALIVSAIHELESANARYSALLSQAREIGVTRTFWEAEAMHKEEQEEAAMKNHEAGW